MSTSIRFGAGRRCEVALDEPTVLAPRSAGPPLRDSAALVRAALAAPLDFPPLAAATTPSDRVAVALGAGVPNACRIIVGAVAEIAAAGIDPAHVTVVAAGSAKEVNSIATALAEAGHAAAVVRHDPDDEQAVAMLGMTAADRPLRLNRVLVEADFVLPIAAARLASGGPPRRFEGIFPQFASREALTRLGGDQAGEPRKRRQERERETEEAGWLLGVLMTVSVVAGPAGEVAAVVAGDPAAVAREATARFTEIWEQPAERAGDLVIAAVGGDAGEQTWENVARALSASERVLAPDGAIALCTALDEPPAGSFHRLLDADDLSAVERELRSHPAPDSAAAMILTQALGRGPVYLRSDLPAEMVESMGMTPLASDAELGRLAARRGHCVVIEEAQHVLPRLTAAPA